MKSVDAACSIGIRSRQITVPWFHGVTRVTAMELARRHAIDERRIMPQELSEFSECFITGTAAEITAVSDIADWKFTPGRITQTLMSDYTAEVKPKGKAAAA